MPTLRIQLAQPTDDAANPPQAFLHIVECRATLCGLTVDATPGAWSLPIATLTMGDTTCPRCVAVSEAVRRASRRKRWQPRKPSFLT
jgi:hypothetical protein